MNTMNAADEKRLKSWVDALLAATVHELTDKQVVAGAMLEARPAWYYPYRVLIGMIREQGEVNSFSWFISGDLPTAIADSSVAATPREAGRYFALRWHLDAARGSNRAAELAANAEYLYQFVNRDELWPE